MNSVSMSGSIRENVGKKDAKKLRREGRIPAVIYGGKEQIHFSVDEKAFEKTLHSPESFIFNLDIDGKNVNGVVYDVQFHPVTDRPLHVDFREIVDGKPVKVRIPIRLNGSSKGVLQGGVLYVKTRKLFVEGLVENMPDYLNIDITEMKIGDSFQVKDIETKDLTILTNPSTSVVSIKTSRTTAAVASDDDEEENEGSEASEASSEE
jgi:large subunit ribosomal protein L25